LGKEIDMSISFEDCIYYKPEGLHPCALYIMESHRVHKDVAGTTSTCIELHGSECMFKKCTPKFILKWQKRLV